jgi:hypothetical protein
MFRQRWPSVLFPLPLLLVACPIIDTPRAIAELTDLRVLSGSYSANLTAESSETTLRADLEASAEPDPATYRAGSNYSTYLVAGKVKIEGRTLAFSGKVDGAGQVNGANKAQSYVLNVPLTEAGKEVGTLIGIKYQADISSTQQLTLVLNDSQLVYRGDFKH